SGRARTGLAGACAEPRTWPHAPGLFGGRAFAVALAGRSRLDGADRAGARAHGLAAVSQPALRPGATGAGAAPPRAARARARRRRIHLEPPARRRAARRGAAPGAPAHTT